MIMYICPIEYYPNCRVCDGGIYTKVMFFKCFSDLYKFALDNLQDYAIMDIYNKEGNIVGAINHEYDCHSCIGFKLEIYEGMNKGKYKTLDDGRGSLYLEKL